MGLFHALVNRISIVLMQITHLNELYLALVKMTNSSDHNYAIVINYSEFREICYVTLKTYDFIVVTPEAYLFVSTYEILGNVNTLCLLPGISYLCDASD